MRQTLILALYVPSCEGLVRWLLVLGSQDKNGAGHGLQKQSTCSHLVFIAVLALLSNHVLDSLGIISEECSTPHCKPLGAEGFQYG